MSAHVYLATIFDLNADGSLQVLSPGGYLVVGEDGLIHSKGVNFEPHLAPEGAQIHDFSHCCIVPGFIDTHTHLAQHAFAGIGDLPLLPWLEKYTFPHEAGFASADVARREARAFFQACMRAGTTTVAAYVTSHTHAVDIAFEEAKIAGLRVFLGKVLMDRNAPEALTEPAPQALAACEGLIERWHGKNAGKLNFAVSPRFAITCTGELLHGAGILAKKNALVVQTHLSENTEEIKKTLALFPQARHYTGVYDDAGLLHARTLLGHGIHLGADEKEVIKLRASTLTHCPTSNRFLASGIMPLRVYLNEGLKVSLGTDVAGGYSVSMLHEMREACETSKTYAACLQPALQPLRPAEALALGTAAGARALGLENRIGRLASGFEADFVICDDLQCHPLALAQCPVTSGSIGRATVHRSLAYMEPLERLSRLIYRGPQATGTVRAVYVGGRKVFEN